MAGRMGPSELVAVYGASAILVVPVTAATEATGPLAAARRARRVVRLLRLRPLLDPPADPVPIPPGARTCTTRSPACTPRPGAHRRRRRTGGRRAGRRLPRFPGATTPARSRGSPSTASTSRRCTSGWSTPTPRTCDPRDGCATSSSRTAARRRERPRRGRRRRDGQGFPEGLDEHLGEHGQKVWAASASAWRWPGCRAPTPTSSSCPTHLRGRRPRRGMDRGPDRGAAPRPHDGRAHPGRAVAPRRRPRRRPHPTLERSARDRRPRRRDPPQAWAWARRCSAGTGGR